MTDFSGPTSFSVDGIPVDAGATLTTLSTGVRVEEHRTMCNGVMVADRLKIEDPDATSDGTDNSGDDMDEADQSDLAGAEREGEHEVEDGHDATGDDSACDTRVKSSCEADHKQD